ncbi:MAG: hypothetical protein A2687_01920 [Candidatus Levybacteria bacterium RIFCSPHIGHO2_01_FULL_38_26]|nr:MAG: hypothetical protein A2687_01920 [Candidatus Levybacteria bacterium RIFCSPHIGHO2_01_FULL_38_26]
MKIGIDCRLWNESGVGRYIRNLTEQLLIIDRKNSYVFFVLSKDRKEILRSVQNDRFKIITADIRWHTIEEQWRFPSILNKENLDLVHFPYFSVPIFYNKPFIVTIHDLILHHFPTGEASTLALPLYQLKLLGYKSVISNGAKKAKKIITVSNATKAEIVDHLKVDPSKVVVTYEGVGINSRLKVKTSKLKVKNYFLYVGNAYPHKNLERLIEAFNLVCHPEALAEGSNDIKLVLVGKEDYFYKRLKEKVKNMGLEKSVLFLGEVSDEELMILYKNARVLVMPSLMEGFGLPAVEAMANKCLVLASDIPTFREICGGVGVYFDPKNSEEIAKNLIPVLDSGDKYRDKIEKGFERVKMFSWEKMAKETLRVYEDNIAY